MKTSIKVGEELLPVECRPLTMELYRKEFGTSMPSDVYGVIDLTAGGEKIVTAEFVIGCLEAHGNISDEFKERIKGAFPANVITKIDFTLDSWDAYLRALWAMRKTADDSTPHYAEWVKTLPDLDLRDVSTVLYQALGDSLFGGSLFGEVQAK